MSSASSPGSDISSVKRQLLEKVSELAAALEKETAAREEAVARLRYCETDKMNLFEYLNENASTSKDSPGSKQDQSTDPPPEAERQSVVARDQEILTLRYQLKLVTEYSAKQDETIASLDAKLQFTQEQADKAESSAVAAVARSKRLGREAESAARKQEEAESHTRAVDRITTKAQRLLVILRQTEKHRDSLQDELDSTKYMLKSAMEAKDAAMYRAGNSAAELIECQRQLQEAKAVADLGADEETPVAKAASAESTSGVSRHSIDHDAAQQGDQDGDDQAAEPSAQSTTTSAGAGSAGSSGCAACAASQERCTALQRELDALKQRFYDLQQRAMLATDAEAGLERRAEEAETELRRASRAAAAAEGELEREKAQRRADAAAHTSSMAGLREECIDLETALRDRRTEVKRLRDAMGEMGDGASRLQQKEEKRESEIARLRATCHRLRAEAVQASAEVHTLRGEAEAEKIRARRAAEESASLRSELDAAAGRAAEAQRGARLARATAEATAAQLGGALVASASGGAAGVQHGAAAGVQGQPQGTPATRSAMKRTGDQHGALHGGTDSEDQLDSSGSAKQPDDDLSDVLKPLDWLRALRGADEVAAAVERAFRGALGTAPQADLLAQAAGALSAWHGKEDAKAGDTAVDADGTGGTLAGAGLQGNKYSAERGPASSSYSANAPDSALKRPMEAACWALLGQAAADGVRADRAGLRSTRRRAAAVLARLAFTSREAVGRLTAQAMTSQANDGAGDVPASIGPPAELLGAPGSHLDPEVVRVTSLGLSARSSGAGAGISAASMPSSSLPVARMLFSRKGVRSAEVQGAGLSASAGAATSKGAETEEGTTPGDVLRMPSCLHASALALGDDGLASVLGALRGASAWELVAGEQQQAARRSYAGLEALDLRHNGITDLGAAAIAGMLADSGRGGASSEHVAQHRWRLVDLRGNRLTSTGVRDLAEALRDCSSTLGVKHVLVGQDGMLRGLGDLPSRASHSINEYQSSDYGAGTAPLVALIDCRAQRPVHEAAANADKPDSVSAGGRGSQQAAVLHRLPEEDGSVLLSARIGAKEVAIGERGQVEAKEEGPSKRDGRMQASWGPGGPARGGSGSLDTLAPYATPPSVLPPLGPTRVASKRAGHGRGTGGVAADQYGVGDEGKEGDAMAAIDKALAAMGKSQDPMDVIRAADLAIKGRSRMHS